MTRVGCIIFKKLLTFSDQGESNQSNKNVVSKGGKRKSSSPTILSCDETSLKKRKASERSSKKPKAWGISSNKRSASTTQEKNMNRSRRVSLTKKTRQKSITGRYSFDYPPLHIFYSLYLEAWKCRKNMAKVWIF